MENQHGGKRSGAGRKQTKMTVNLDHMWRRIAFYQWQKREFEERAIVWLIEEQGITLDREAVAKHLEDYWKYDQTRLSEK